MSSSIHPKVVCNSEELDDLLRTTLALLVATGGFDVGVVRVADGVGLRSRVSIGLDAEVSEGFTSPECSVAEPTAQLRLVPIEDPRVSDVMRRGGVRTAYWLPLPHRAASVAACLGSCAGGELAEERRSQLEALAKLTAVAMESLHTSRRFEESLRARDQNLADIAHDLKNSLNSISLSATLLDQRLEPASPLRAVVDRIARNTQRASGFIEAMLSTGAIEAGKLALKHELLDPAELVLSAAGEQQDASVGKGVLLDIDLTPGLGQVQADRERIIEVFENLVGNALKFTNPSGTITLGAAPRGDEILFYVKDTGSGIPAQQLTPMFERYWRAKAGHGKGAGLGLSICKGIIEAHGGRIWAESSVGVGTTVMFTLPVERQRSAVERATSATILIVDDRPGNRQALEAILEGPGYRIITAASGREALSIALREELSVVLLDVEMPGMSGFETASHLKLTRRTRSVPIVFVTADGHDPEKIYRAYGAGGADYLVKPLDPEIVRRKVAVFAELARRRAQRDSNQAPGA